MSEGGSLTLNLYSGGSKVKAHSQRQLVEVVSWYYQVKLLGHTCKYPAGILNLLCCIYNILFHLFVSLSLKSPLQREDKQ